MSEDVSNPDYWQCRLRDAKERHHSVFRCPLNKWQAIESRHREILAATIGADESVLDAGCGWGRLLTLMPATWRGPYLGIDLSPDFIALARHEHPHRPFSVMDLRDLSSLPRLAYDWAVLISIRPMVRRNLGDDVWQRMEIELRRVAKRLLFLEYDENDGGSVE